MFRTNNRMSKKILLLPEIIIFFPFNKIKKLIDNHKVDIININDLDITFAFFYLTIINNYSLNMVYKIDENDLKTIVNYINNKIKKM